MISVSDLMDGTATAVPDNIARLYQLVNEAMLLEAQLEDMEATPQRPEVRLDIIWDKGLARTMRRVARLEAALMAHNKAEVMECG